MRKEITLYCGKKYFLSRLPTAMTMKLVFQWSIFLLHAVYSKNEIINVNVINEVFFIKTFLCEKNNQYWIMGKKKFRLPMAMTAKFVLEASIFLLYAVGFIDEVIKVNIINEVLV